MKDKTQGKHGRVKQLASYIMHKRYCENDAEAVAATFADGISCYGAGEGRHRFGRQNVAEFFCAAKGGTGKCSISGEEYGVFEPAPGTYVCTGGFWLEAAPSGAKPARIRQEVSLVFAEQGGELKCVHINSSNPCLEERRCPRAEEGRPCQYAQEEMRQLEEKVAAKSAELNDELNLRDNVLNLMGSGVFAYTTPAREILIVNEEAKRFLGVPGERDGGIIKQKIEDLMKANSDAVMRAVRNLKKPGDSALYRLEIPREGSNAVIEVLSKLLQFDDGRRFVLSTMRDITENERLSKMLQEERQQYRDALIKNSEYFYSFDVTDGYLRDDIILPDKTGMVTSLGLPLPVKYDDFCKASLELNKVEVITPGLEKLLTCEGIIGAYNSGITNTTVEHYFGSRDEYTRTVMLFSKNEETGHIHAFMVANNITEERKKEIQAEQDLHRQYEIANSFAKMFFASWLLDLNENTLAVLNVPEYGLKVTEGKDKIEIEKAVENYAAFCVGDESKKEVRAFLDFKTVRARLRNRPVLLCDYKWKENEWRRIHLIPLGGGSAPDPNRMILAVQNITTEKLKDEMAKQALVDAYNSATRANNAKTEFLSRMSHDIRTPMNAIVGMTAIAEARLDDKERVRDCLGKITVASKHLLGLINDVLDMSKIESGRLDLQLEAFTIAELLETLVTISRPQIEAAGHKLTVTERDIRHADVLGDSQRLQQALMNLISNAIKYTPNGGSIKLDVCEKATNKQNVGCYEFIIEDNGIGMSPEFLARIFEPFSRAEDERVSKIQGTGLGMSITKNLVQMMNGDIKVESTPGKGTKILVTVFLQLQGEGSGGSAEGGGSAGVGGSAAGAKDSAGAGGAGEKRDFSLKDFESSAFAGKRVLLVEDNEINLEIAAELLGMAKLEVETARNGKEAVEKVSAASDGYYDMIFMDVQMPVMTGHEAARAIRALGRDYTSRVPIVAMTANAFSDDVVASKNAGMNEHIAKPLKFELLWQVMCRWLG